MDRHDSVPRQGWEAKLEEDGLIYWRTDLPDGGQTSYWNERAYYSLTEAEGYDIEATARLILNDMLVEAGDFIIENNLFSRMGIPGWVVPAIVETWNSEPPMLYGRFDFAYGPDSVPRLLEFNADTPTALLETAAIQWRWATDVFGDPVGQWNNVHQALIDRWTELRTGHRLPGAHVHFLHTGQETSGEDFITVAYMVEVARQAGMKCDIVPIEKLRFDDATGFIDPRNEPVRTAFKLYPWEWMVHEEFCQPALQRMGDGEDQTQWIEPIWKMLWSNKGILPILWHLHPGHPNLLPAYFQDAEAGGWDGIVDVFGAPLDRAALVGASFVRKPLLSREGANIALYVDGVLEDEGPEQHYGDEGFVIQQYADLGTYGEAGARPVLGVWVVDMEPQGLGIRESDRHITNNLSRFVPHIIA